MAFVADNTQGVVVVDISRPATPRVITTIPTQAAAAGVTLSRDGRRLFIADQANGIAILDVSNPQQPQALARLLTRGHAQAVALSSDNRRLYSANNTGGLQIFALDNPRQPQLLGSFATRNAFSLSLHQTIAGVHCRPVQWGAGGGYEPSTAAAKTQPYPHAGTCPASDPASGQPHPAGGGWQGRGHHHQFPNEREIRDLTVVYFRPTLA
ncbi:MAG: hypothetical protein R3E89_13070 [Thiolinea sp.]